MIIIYTASLQLISHEQIGIYKDLYNNLVRTSLFLSINTLSRTGSSSLTDAASKL